MRKSSSTFNCDYLHKMSSQYQFIQDREWDELNLSKCWAEKDSDCIKKRNKRQLSSRCWTIKKKAFDEYVKKTVEKLCKR
jgi:hypothetical protein